MKVVKLHVASGLHPSRTLKMWWWLIGVGGDYSLPGGWNDLQWKQVREIAKLLFSNQNIYVLKLLLVKTIAKMPVMAFNWISDADKLYLSDQVIWATDLDKLNLTKQLLPTYRKLTGPGDNLSNITIDEFGFADRCFDKYLQTKDVADLDKLVAILYRKRRKDGVNDGDDRIPFNNHTIESDAALVKHWPMDVKQGVLLFFWGCRNLIVKKHPEKFSKAGGDGGGAKANWFDIISSMAGGKFGTIEETKKVNVWVFMREWVKASKKV